MNLINPQIRAAWAAIEAKHKARARQLDAAQKRITARALRALVALKALAAKPWFVCDLNQSQSKAVPVRSHVDLRHDAPRGPPFFVKAESNGKR